MNMLRNSRKTEKSPGVTVRAEDIYYSCRFSGENLAHGDERTCPVTEESFFPSLQEALNYFNWVKVKTDQVLSDWFLSVEK